MDEKIGGGSRSQRGGEGGRVFSGQTVCVSPEWRGGTEGYILSSRRNIALRSDSPLTKCAVLYSNTPTYFCGQTLTFK